MKQTSHQHSTVRGGVSQQPVSNSEQTAGQPGGDNHYR
jgi:hypothetical protein